MIPIILKGLAMGAYMLFEHYLGKTKYGSFIGVILNLIQKKGIT